MHVTGDREHRELRGLGRHVLQEITTIGARRTRSRTLRAPRCSRATGRATISRSSELGTAGGHKVTRTFALADTGGTLGDPPLVETQDDMAGPRREAGLPAVTE